MPGRLRVKPRDRVTPDLLHEIKAKKREIAESLRKHETLSSIPYINDYGELVIPFTADRKCHYWDGGMSIKDILWELNSSDEVMGNYVDKRRFH